MENYWQKLDQNPYKDLLWNLPETKQGSINILGGHAKSFNTEIKTAEFLATNFPIKDVKNLLPKSLQNSLPPLDNFIFLPDTDSGSFAASDELNSAINTADFTIVLGDFSKNSITEKAVGSACQSSEKPLLITRDAVDIIAETSAEQILLHNHFIFASMPGLQKIFRSVYYPKVITLSQSLLQITDALHKFTLSYPTTIITLHLGQIIVANNGKVATIPLDQTAYSPLTIWQGQLAARIATLNLFNPKKPFEATICAIFG